MLVGDNMSKISLNKEDYGINVGDNLYHGDISLNHLEDTYKFNSIDDSKEHETLDSEVLESKKELKLICRKWFLFGCLAGIVAFVIVFNLSLKLCDLILYLEPYKPFIFGKISNFKGIFGIVLLLTIYISLFRCFLRFVYKLRKF